MTTSFGEWPSPWCIAAVAALATACGSNAPSKTATVPASSLTALPPAAASSNQGNSEAAPDTPSAPPLAPVQITLPVPTPATVTVTKSGDKKTQRKLTVAANVGDRFPMQYVFGSKFAGPKNEVSELPPSVLRGVAEVVSADSDRFGYRFTVEAVDVLPIEKPVRPIADLKRQMQIVKGLELSGSILPNGVTTIETLAHPAGPPTLGRLLATFDPMLPRPLPLPAAPVGNGAAYTVVEAWEVNGVPLTLTYQCHVAIAKTVDVTCDGNVSGNNQNLENAAIANKHGTASYVASFTGRPFGSFALSRDPAFTLSTDTESANVTLSYQSSWSTPP